MTPSDASSGPWQSGAAHHPLDLSCPLPVAHPSRSASTSTPSTARCSAILRRARRGFSKPTRRPCFAESWGSP